MQTTEKAIIRKEKHLEDDSEVDDDDEVIYKIEVAANRSAGFVFHN
jgi:phenylalanyl-tRNA synthetase beta chain